MTLHGSRCLAAHLLVLAFTLEPFIAAASGNVVGTGNAGPPKPVSTARLSEVVFFPYRDAPAMAISINDTRVSSELDGVLSTINVRVGDKVKKGDLIAHIDCRDYRLAVDEAEAAFRAGQAKHDFDKSQLETARKLNRTKTISAEELDKRSANTIGSAAETDRLRALVARAKRDAESCDLRAPFDGVVIEQISNLGDYQLPGNAVLRILDTKNIEVSAKVQEQDLEALKSVKDLKFITQGKEYALALRAILPFMDSRVHSYEVRMTFSEELAPPGSVGRLRWVVSQPHVPANLLVHKGELGVFFDRDGRAEFLPLQNAIEGHPAAIGIPLSQKIVIDGRFGLEHGDAIRAIEP